ncbi:MAG: hypothetical protein P8N76_20570 [Pirellulaceae bacterium]|nr:hypothetical protein [Pirellulaceae bacterium]
MRYNSAILSWGWIASPGKGHGQASATTSGAIALDFNSEAVVGAIRRHS